ncbi:ribonuclease HII [Thermoclostridium stercorarium subsp. stercorarium DSM 8532]|jgi:ribonuclease HII|uniref:Ribonuclease HII n=3 Tax=Thermoclostridium stercorarium TaxID=1510 RepID=L7VQU1_THES1|nr:ribonuclease HII [Thermoclostridium stercorarium]AGC69044.1 ribonuclease HII [Thermoclostridium stercorarium subsp. stercorarium DSM 8532]AGI40018.1 ribonuclease H2 [Thermoclostridium stercorarium subsp. stercorarium DSM 8532]ANW99337.1 ribonuclease HII [Thermoclostridium stercorarium subsp. thermolacticum DSM 2910]ANX01966.1 ribonuclease HII [Thermoclostridium stercorarium subsp. leptospartum DSM 9219]UZQ85008.1 ribonuclease HII [Thermoclostridium stercorarium]
MDKKMTLAEIRQKAETMPLEEAVSWLCDIIPDYGISVAKLADTFSKRLVRLREEKRRLLKMSEFEIHARKQGFVHIGGIDEAGRGPLAGPVVAGCVVLPENCFIEHLNDSKKLTPSMRDRLFDIIIEEAVDYGIGMVMPEEIDEINIYNATKKAMMQAVSNMKKTPDYLIIDAMELPLQISQLSLKKGDSLSISVAAASIIAKVTRDRWMEEAHKLYPQYGFDRHKGYGTEEHMEAIRKYGLCPIHRKSFTHGLVG